MIRKYVVTRIDIDFYVTDEYELTPTRRGTEWEKVCSFSYSVPNRADYHPAALKRHPWQSIRKIGGSYTFFACVYRFPDPRLAGKWADYSTAYGFESQR